MIINVFFVVMVTSKSKHYLVETEDDGQPEEEGIWRKPSDQQPINLNADYNVNDYMIWFNVK